MFYRFHVSSILAMFFSQNNLFWLLFSCYKGFETVKRPLYFNYSLLPVTKITFQMSFYLLSFIEFHHKKGKSSYLHTLKIKQIEWPAVLDIQPDWTKNNNFKLAQQYQHIWSVNTLQYKIILQLEVVEFSEPTRLLVVP